MKVAAGSERRYLADICVAVACRHIAGSWSPAIRSDGQWPKRRRNAANLRRVPLIEHRLLKNLKKEFLEAFSAKSQNAGIVSLHRVTVGGQREQGDVGAKDLFGKLL